jgi:hypothetical protein
MAGGSRRTSKKLLSQRSEVENQTIVTGESFDCNSSHVRDEVVGGLQRLSRMRERSRNHDATRGATGFGARRCIFEDHAILGLEAEQRRAGTIRGWIGLSQSNALGSDQARRNGKCSLSETNAGETLRGTGDNGPPIWRQGREKLEHSGQDRQIIAVSDFDIFNDSQLGVAIEIWAQSRNGLNCAATMCNLSGVLWIDPAHLSPLGPASLYRVDRRDKNAIHIEEKALTANLNGGRGDEGSHIPILEGGDQFYRFVAVTGLGVANVMVGGSASVMVASVVDVRGPC